MNTNKTASTTTDIELGIIGIDMDVCNAFLWAVTRTQDHRLL